tara:strand:- start:1348 stop:1620 length:273 start_codon:yes stop_codon:yes gene_type:complete
MSECPKGWIPDPKNKNKCIYDKKSSIKKGEVEYQKHKSKQTKSPKPASKSELSKMKKDYSGRVSKIPDTKKKKDIKKKEKKTTWLSRFFK